jgi:polyketide biosynthesis 3-hydroxy-3-methylglutaryl-CoA synthase-like enzyme PksG
MDEYDALLVSNSAVSFGTRNVVLDTAFIPEARRVHGGDTLFLTEIREFQRQYACVA